MVLQMMLKESSWLGAVPATECTNSTKCLYKCLLAQDEISLIVLGHGHEFGPCHGNVASQGTIGVEGLATACLDVAPECKVAALDAQAVGTSRCTISAVSSWMAGVDGSKTQGRAW